MSTWTTGKRAGYDRFGGDDDDGRHDAPPAATLDELLARRREMRAQEARNAKEAYEAQQAQLRQDLENTFIERLQHAFSMTLLDALGVLVAWTDDLKDEDGEPYGEFQATFRTGDSQSATQWTLRRTIHYGAHYWLLSTAEGYSVPIMANDFLPSETAGYLDNHLLDAINDHPAWQRGEAVSGAQVNSRADTEAEEKRRAAAVIPDLWRVVRDHVPCTVRVMNGDDTSTWVSAVIHEQSEHGVLIKPANAMWRFVPWGRIDEIVLDELAASPA